MKGEAAATHPPGLSLVELLIVLVVIGILASFMVFRGTEVTRQANLAVLKSDLRSMTVAQEIHHQLNGEYAPLADLGDFRTSDGVAIELTWRTRDGYAATGTHSGAPATVCGVFRGPAPEGVAGPAEVEGELACQ